MEGEPYPPPHKIKPNLKFFSKVGRGYLGGVTYAPWRDPMSERLFAKAS